MSQLNAGTRRLKHSEEWTQAEGVLPVERALADEHEALHGESITAALEAITVEFDAAQFTDAPALARDLRDSLGPRDSGIQVAESVAGKDQPDLTPRDAVGKVLLRDAALVTALIAFEDADAAAGDASTAQFAAALASTFNALLDKRLMDEPAFRSFLDAGGVDALGDAPAGLSVTDARALFLRRANRELLEAAFPREISHMRDRRLAVVFDAARKRDTAALCLSGGGIRSSTFALGIMQGLARHGLLGKFDYLSTVSGGGLSGGWLSAWMRRDGARAVHESLRTAGKEKLQPEPEPVQGLRGFSHWLTPRAGAMSIDSWTVIATVVRNLLLNWLVLLPLLAALIMLPRLFIAVLALETLPPRQNAPLLIGIAVAVGMLCMLASAGYIEWIRNSGDDLARGTRGAPSETRVLLSFLLPRVLGSVILSLAIFVAGSWASKSDGPEIFRATIGTYLALLLAGALFTIVMGFARKGKQPMVSALIHSLKTLAAGFIGYIPPLVAVFVIDWTRERYVTFAPAMFLMGTVLTSQLYTGLTSDEASDAEREWAARSNAWVMIVSISWMVASGTVLFGPHLIDALWEKLTVLGVGGVSSWITVSLGSKTADNNGGKPSAADSVRNAALSLAMPAVVACLIIGLAAANDGTLNLICVNSRVAAKLNCNPPSEDSTSVPMLRYVADRKGAVLDDVESTFIAKLDRDSSRVPRTPAAIDSMRERDAGLIEASRTLTAAALAYDSVTVRLIRRSGDTTSVSRHTFDDEGDGVLSSFRSFTARRAMTIPNDSVIGTLPNGSAELGPDMLTGVQLVLQTDTALKTGFVERAAAAAQIAAIADSVRKADAHHQPSENALWIGVLVVMAILFVSGVFFSFMINTNTFSLHAMWKARTVRSFLGTTRSAAARNPNPFTGFDSDDDVSLRDLWPAHVSRSEAANPGIRSEDIPPMHVLNVTLNLAAGRNLAWQQRKGESMTLTPLHAGAAFTGYRPMAPRPKAGVKVSPDDDGYGGPGGVTLGTAMAISGAAASPNDGAGTTALGAFLMTFFNARLGWWLGNPGAPGANTWTRSAPAWRLTPILSEMFGLTSDRSQYVYLSDGGHFENLALYEMVFRRNRFILVSDAGADPNYTFEDLGNAVRKIRIDFGIPIEFDNPVNIGGMGTTGGAYWATAKIKYSAVDMPQDAGCKEGDYDGVLVYIKPAVYGKLEPRDVINYANLSPTFPQESSADQFFSESQFESYRALGSWIVDQLVANSAAAGAPATAAAQRGGSLLSDWPGLSPFKSKY
jgi:hypothetical protein